MPVLAAGVVSVGLLVAAAVLVYVQAEHALRTQARARVRGTAALAAQLVGEQSMRFSEFAQVYARALGSLSDRPIEQLPGAKTPAGTRELQTLKPAAVITRELEALSGTASGLSSTALISPEGRLLAAQPPMPRYYGQSFAGRDWYRGVISSQAPYVSRVFLAKNRVTTVTVAALVRAAHTGRVIAILTIALQHRTQALADRLARSQGIRLTVTDQAGGLVARSGAGSNALVSLRGDPGVGAALRGRSTSSERNGALAAYAPVPATGWTVSASLPTSVAFRDVGRLRTILILVVLILGAVLAACTAGLVRVLRRNEHSQRAEAERFRMLVEAAPDATVVVNERGEIVLVNAEMERLSGYAREELVGRKVELLIPAHRRGAHQTRRAGFFVHPAVRPMGAGLELFALCKDGRELPVEVSLSPLETEKGILVSAAVRDVSGRKRLEYQLRQRAQLLALAHDAIIVREPATSRITYWNREAEEIYGYSAGEARGQSTHELLATEFLHSRASIDAELLARGRWEGELWHTCKDGRRILVSSRQAVQRKHGRPVAIIELNTDVTERRRVEQVNRRLAAIVESTGDAVLSKTPDDIITEWNPAAERLYGYTAGEAIGRPVRMLLAPERAAEEERILARVWAGESIEQLETVRMRKDGSRVHVALTVSPITDRTGQVVAASAIARDISERVRVEQQLRLQGEIVANLSEGVITIRRSDAAIVYTNDAFDRMMGYEPGELLGRPIWVINAPGEREPRQTAADIIGEIERTGEWHGEIENLHKDGRRLWCEAHVVVTEHPDHGQVMIAVHTEITERRRAEQASRRLAALVEATEDAILAMNLEGIITEWNRGAERLFGYSVGEAQGRPVTMLAPPERTSEVEGLLRRVRGGESIEQCETVRLRKDGTLVDVSLTISPLRDRDGVVVAASTIARDITEHKRMEEALKEADRLKTTLLRAAAHDFRSPLTAIAAAAEASALPNLGVDTRQELQRIIVGEANRLSRLVGKLLDLSRLEAGSAAPRQVSYSLETIVASALEQIPSREDGFRLVFEPDLPDVFVDPAQLERAFVNLFENSKRFASAAPVQLRAVANDGNLVVRVSDDGPGIPSDAREQVFDPFFRIGRDRTTGGSGLGLAIVKGFVEANGGRVFVEPLPPGRGATFVVELPVVGRHAFSQERGR